MAKVQDVAKFFIDLAQKQASHSQGDLMTNLRLQKLLYFAQGWHIARTGKPLFDEDMKKWKFGPVVPSVYHDYKENGNSGIAYPIELSDDAFSEEEMKVLLDVAREYSVFSTSKLVDLSHASDGPWAHTCDGATISKEAIREYFLGQEPLSSFDDMLSKIETIEPIDVDGGIAVFPSELDDEWEDDDASI